MRYKKGLIFICLIICLFSIASVCAGDVNETQVASDKQMIFENQDKIGSTEEQNLSNSVGTFTDLANEIANAEGVLNLTKNYIYSNDFDYTSGIKINNQITINGNGFQINGNNQSRAFTINSNNVILANISFINCSYHVLENSNGGSIYWKGNGGNLFNCSFTNCYSYSNSSSSTCSSCGGAVYWNGDNSNLFNCSFVNSYANSYAESSYSYSDAYGGAIYLSGSNIKLSNCDFINCYSNSNTIITSYGGAIYGWGNNVSIFNCNFRNNSVGGSAGAIYWNGKNGIMLNCNFTNNFIDNLHTSSNTGGAISWNNKNSTISNCIFINNSGGYGGAIDISGGNYQSSVCNVLNCTFLNNFAYNGAAIHWNSINGTVINCNFINNSAESSGGAIQWSGFGQYKINGVVYNCTFINNFVNHYGNGGAISCYSINGTISNCKFLNNSVNQYGSGNDAYGGAIYLSSSNATLFNCNFTNNSVMLYGSYGSAYGGAVYFTGTNIIALNCNFMNNSISQYGVGKFYGGAIYCNGFNGNISYCNFTNNSLKNPSKRYSHNGGIIYLSGDNGFISNCNLIDNHVADYGGAVYCDASNSAIFNSNFKNNHAGNCGGAIFLSSDDGFISNCNFTDNYALSVGQSFYGNGKNNIIMDSSFVDNNSFYDIYCLDDCQLINCNYTSINEKCHIMFKSFIKLNLSSEIINYGDTILLNTNITSGATGNVSIYLNGDLIKNVPINELFILDNLPVGIHNIKVIYNGDNYYARSENSTILKVNKINSVLHISNVLIAGNIKFNVTLNNQATGNVTISVNDKKYTEEVYDGIALIYIPDLIAGNYNFTVEYSGDENFNMINKSLINLNVKFQNTILNVYSNNYYFNEVVSINYNITSGAKGVLDIYVNNTFIKSVSIGEKIELEDLTTGIYNISVLYNSDGYYESCKNSILLEIYKLNPSFVLDSNKVIAGSIVKINYNISSGATGVLSVYVNDTFIKYVDVGKNIELEGLKEGIYEIKVLYESNNYFKNAENTTSLEVYKLDSSFKLEPTKIFAGENVTLNLIFEKDVTGDINISFGEWKYQDDKNIWISKYDFTSKLVNGKTNIQILNLIGGWNNYIVDYGGNERYNSFWSTGKFYVEFKKTNIVLSSENCNVDEIAIINYNLELNSTGTLSIFDNEMFVKNVSVNEKIQIGNLTAGVHTIKVVYNGDDYFAPCINTTEIEIYKLYPDFYIEEEFDLISGKNINLTFIFNDDVTGNVNISIGEWVEDENDNDIWIGKYNFTNSVINGKICIPIPELGGGWHDYLIKYEGNDMYDSMCDTTSIYVEYRDSPININIPKINWADTVKFTPNLPKGATGNIELLVDNITLANITVGNSYSYKAVNGGKHYLTIKYFGDDYFIDNETTVEFHVNKLDSNFSIENTFDSERYITIPITLSEDANGDITVNINNNIYSGKVVNGSFNFTVTDIGVGTHNLVINYTNDNKYNDIYIAKEINVNLKDSNLNLDIQNILSGQNLLIKPTLTEGATGSVDIYVDGSFKKSINVGSSYTLQNPGVGQHKIRLVYSGNTYFESSENEYSFRVFTIYPIVAVDTQIVFGTDKKFQAKFFDEYGGFLANKYVLFIVNGEEYPVKTNGEGIAVLNVDLAVGEYNVTSVSLLDENTTNKLLIFHSVQAESMIIEYGSDTRFKATFLDETAKPLSNTNIVFKVDGKDTMVKTDVNGVAILNSELTLGTHTITSINTITDESMTNKVVVVKDVNSIITVETKDINYNQKATIKVNIDSGYLNANVTIKVTGENGYEEIFTQKAAKSITEELSNLNASKYYVGVKYVDSDLLVIQKNATFNVLKIDPAVTLSVDDEFAGQTITFEVKVSDSNGTLTVKIDDGLSDGQLVDGRFVMNINSLSVGKHSYEILFNGDNNYNPIIKKGTFTIWNKLNFKVDFDSIEIYGDDECTMYVHIQNLSDNKNAILTLFIDGVEVKDQSFTIYEYDDEEYSGEIEFNASNLSEGIHNWKISYYDGLNYINSSQTGLVKVYHVGNPDKVLLVTNDGIIADIEGEFVFVKNGTIKINDDYQEYYTIYSFTANGVEYAAIRWFPVTFYSVSCYKVFNPNEYKLFEGVYYKTTNGIISDVIDSYEEIDGVYYGYVGRPYEYYNNGYDKSYAIINGTCYKSQFYHYYEASEGVDYNVLDGIFYTMDGIKIDDERENYDGFVIIKNGRYYFNDNLYFHHIMSTVGYEYVKINNDFYRLIQTYENEELHNYALIDGKLYPVIGNSIGKSVNLDVRDIINEDEISIPSLDDISGDESVEIKLPSDATGTVTLTVNGKDYKFDVKNGVSNVKLPELTDGNYDYTITYSGDNKYSSFSTNGNMGVNNTKPEDTKPTPQIVIPPLDKPSADGLVTIALPGDATGKVTLSINGKDYSYLVENGVANVIIPNLGEGNYPYTITYSGDSKYSQFTTNGVLNKTAPKLNPKITAKNTVVQYSAKGKYSVTVYGTNGKVASGVQVIFKISGKQVAKVKTNVKGVASYVVTKNPAKYKIQATALGKSVTKTLTVKHIVTLKTVTLKKSAKKITLQATLAKVNGKYLKKKTITFKINGKKVASAKTNSKGVAKITIKNPNVVKKLKVGKKITYQATYLKDTVKKTAKIKK